MSKELIENWATDSADYQKNNQDFYKQLRKLKEKQLDQQFHQLDADTFAKMDCLDCANCCKTTSPIFYQPDIERVSKALKMKVPDFINTYLFKDEEGDYVLQSSPCPFLGYDNKCIVYKSRPTACREYPHTNRKRMRQILSKTFKNAEVCPAVFHILERMREVRG
ncbi:zinc/iron-chelating domain-containing protein [Marivirga lumbricoides]|uniref:Zinc/iron-chelating domain-containing protein n=1 Tax=Marivirga lumbricoides TaxID=1046115 RepID=A0A2T4DQW7_9BACT|nr:zinc/iron-chelating domain-containing protein [Marivirga lumbricoides]